MRIHMRYLAPLCLLASLAAIGSTTNTSTASANGQDVDRRLTYSTSALEDDAALVAKGKALYSNYKCYECHGQTGKGTDDAPALTDSILSADEVSIFLQ